MHVHLSKLKGTWDRFPVVFTGMLNAAVTAKSNLPFVHNEVWNFHLHALIMNLISLDKLTAESQVLKIWGGGEEKSTQPPTSIFSPCCHFYSSVMLSICMHSHFCLDSSTANSFPNPRHMLPYPEKWRSRKTTGLGCWAEKLNSGLDSAVNQQTYLGCHLASISSSEKYIPPNKYYLSAYHVPGTVVSA